MFCVPLNVPLSLREPKLSVRLRNVLMRVLAFSRQDQKAIPAALARPFQLARAHRPVDQARSTPAMNFRGLRQVGNP